MTATLTPDVKRPVKTRRPVSNNEETATLVAAAALTLLVTVRDWWDPDVWWHVAVGRRILQSGIPSVEPFSFAPAAHAWVGQQWLYEVILAKLTDIGGAGLVSAVMGALGSLAFLVAALAVRRPTASAAVRGIALGATTLVAAQVLGPRGQVVTVLGCAITLLIVTRWRAGHTRIVWALPPLLLVWANLHAGFWVGLLLPAGGAAVVAVQRRWGQGAIAQVRPLLVAAGLAALATLMTPAGVHLWSYIADTFTTPTLTDGIVEWQSPDFHTWGLRLLEILVVALVLSWTFARQRLDPLDAVFAVGALAMTLQAQRNLALLCVVMTPQLAAYGADAAGSVRDRISAARNAGPSRPTSASGERSVRHRQGRARRRRPLPAGVLWSACAIVVGASLAMNVAPLLTSAHARAYERSHEPAAAADYVAINLPGRRLYSTYEWGGYLAGRFPTTRVVWIYGESEVFGEARLQEYLDVHVLRPTWLDTLQRNGMRDAVVPAGSREAAAMETVGWGILCSDADSGAVVLEADRGATVGNLPSPAAAPPCVAQ